jgi:ATP-dependent helicase/nuclease subunit B
VKVLAHPDPCVLESTLLRRLNADHPRHQPARSLVLVPTSRLAAHVHRRLASAGDRPAWLGVEVTTFHRLALDILEHSGNPPPRVLSRRMREAVVRLALRARPENSWTRFVERRPGALGRMTAGLNDLREANLRPVEVRECCAGGAWNEALAELYTAYVELLVARESGGWADEAALIHAALEHLPSYARGFRQVYLHGAYELIGVNLALLRALDAQTPVTALLPILPEGRLTRHAERFARDHLLENGEECEAITDAGDEGCRLELAALYDESKRPTPVSTDRIAIRHTQGALAEVQFAMYRALRAIADGCPPHEIAIVARSLAPYASAIEATFENSEIEWTSSLRVPLRREPLVRDFLLVLEVLADDFPRRAAAAVLRSPMLRWTELPDVERAPMGHLADSWSRRARIIGGLDEWSELLPEWAARPAEPAKLSDEERMEEAERARERLREARCITTALQALKRCVPPEPLRWGEHARALRRLLDGLFAVDGNGDRTAAGQALGALLDEMESLDSLDVGPDPIPFAKVRGWLQDAVNLPEFSPWRGDRGGIRVLDAMQARGLTFRRVYLLGMNSGVFPRTPREDPVLGGDLRRRLRDETRLPLSVGSEGTEEERLLLGLMLGASRDAIEVSWQRANDSGRSSSISLALREVARLVYGEPDLDRLRREARTIPSHPLQWLGYLAEETGLLSARDAILLHGLQSSGPEAVDRFAARYTDLRGGLRMLKTTQAFETVEPGFDARVDRSLLPERFSASALEVLGRCPLQFFFRHVLRVRELDDEAATEAISPRDLGIRIHEILAGLYGTLEKEGRFAAGDPDGLRARASEWLASRRERLLGELGTRAAFRLPVLWRLTLTTWFDSLSEFVRRDLERIVDEGWQPGGFETPHSEKLDLDEGVRLEIVGRFDRCLTKESRKLIGDYKTSGDLDRRVNLSRMLKGEQLQVPLYLMMGGEDSTVELLGVGPAYDLDDEDSHPHFDGFPKDEHRRGFLETLRTLVALPLRGRFPLNEKGPCSWCPYKIACRRNHPPTIHRETRYDDGRRYRALLRKNRGKPFLRDLDVRDG